MTDVTGPDKTTAASPGSEDHLRLALDIAQIATWDWDILNNRLTYGGHHFQLFGTTADAPGPTVEDFLKHVHPEDRSRIQEALRRALAEGVPYQEELRLSLPDGRLCWMAARGKVYRDAAGRAVRMIGVAQEITERKLAEKALRDSEERYRSLFQTNPHPMLAYDWETTLIVAVNDAAVEHYGYCREEFLTRSIYDIHPVEDLPRLRKHLETPPPAGKVGIWRHQKKDGTIIDVEIRGHWITLDGRQVRFVLAHDVTERLRTEEALRSSEAKYRSLVENLELRIFLKDRAGRYVAANAPFCQVLGRPEAEIVGQTDADLYAPTLAVKHRSEDLQVLTHGQRIEVEGPLELTGQQRIIRVVKTPVRDEHGSVTGVLGICWDVTEQRHMEAQFRQAQKMDAIGMLAGGVAHDFNNLLAVIVGNIALALGGLPENHPSRELLLTAEKAGVQAADLTNRLLGFSRQTILRPVPTRLHNCVEETVRILRRTVDPRIALDVKTAPELWLVEADPAQINQVLLNLCLNARDAMPQGGRLLLQAENVTVDADYARQHVEGRPGEFVHLCVSDTGQGIPPEVRSRIFEPFFTTKEPGKGTGLGLAMVFGIIKQHQGWIDFYSEVGQGTTFNIYLPRHLLGSEPPPAPPKPRQAPRGGTETILLADDEPMIRKLGRTILERYGYKVLLAEDGLEAVQVYQREKDAISLVILDLTMPRLSGHDALQHLLQLDPHVRVLFASGYSAEHLDQAYHEHVQGFLNKPFRPEQLAQVVREVLDKAATR